MSGLASLAESLLGPGVAVAGGGIAAWALPLMPAEEAAVARAVPARRAEFAAGRAAARAALARLGPRPSFGGALPRGADGAPLWPPGTLGSITHGGGVALAAVARRAPGLAALGLDVEPLAFPEGLADAVRRPDERGAPARLFSAKEAALKALLALGHRPLGLLDLRVALAGDGFAAEALPLGLVVRGRQAVAGGLVLSAARAAPARRFVGA